MKKLMLIIGFCFFSISTFAQKEHYVSSYITRNGKYVEGHYRTNKDYTKNNNYITIGNTNPHTLKSGYRNGGLNYVPMPVYTPATSYTLPASSTNTIYTGSRGGQYYINKNGNKTYIKN